MISNHFFLHVAWERLKSCVDFGNHHLISRIISSVSAVFHVPVRAAGSALHQFKVKFEETSTKAALLFIRLFCPKYFLGSALGQLAYNNKKELLEWIIKKGINPNIRDTDGKTPLIYASFNGHEEVVKMLLNQGADPNLKCNCNFTSLHYAANKGHQQIAQLLLSHRADLNVIGERCLTPALIAYKEGYRSVGDVLGGQAPFHQAWLFHKLINHRFGLGIEILEQGKKLSMDGFGYSITYPVLLDSIDRLRDWEHQGPTNWLESDTEEVLEVIKRAIALTDKEQRSEEENIEMACEYFKKGEIIALPVSSSIFSHANMIIFSPDHVIRGDRAKIFGNTTDYRGLKTQIELFKPGLLIQSLGNRDNVSKAIEIILRGSDSNDESNNNFKFIFKKIEQELDLSSPFYCSHPLQPTDVCAWASSAKLAFRGALIAQLLKKGFSLEDAESYSKKMYKQWTLDDRLSAVQDYIDLVEDSDTKTYVLACVYKLLTLKNNKNETVNSIISLIRDQLPTAVLLAEQVSITEKEGKRICRLENP